jgi:hypothetical protein
LERAFGFFGSRLVTVVVIAVGSSFSSFASAISSLAALPNPKRATGITMPRCAVGCFLGFSASSSPLKKGNRIVGAAVCGLRALLTIK